MSRPKLSPEDLANLPLDATEYEELVPDSELSTTPAIPRDALKRRDVSFRRRRGRAQALVLDILSVYGITSNDIDTFDRACAHAIDAFQKTLVQGRQEIAKALADERAESAGQAARAIDLEAELIRVTSQKDSQ